jgi:hypothetical protein
VSPNEKVAKNSHQHNPSSAYLSAAKSQIKTAISFSPSKPLTPSKCANQSSSSSFSYNPAGPSANNSKIFYSPLKMLTSSSGPHPDGPSSNSIADLHSLPDDAFLSLDPLEENDPYHLLLLDDRDRASTLSSLFGHDNGL